jgi:hypothetical protein
MDAKTATIDFDNLLYLVNMNRGGLYKITNGSSSYVDNDSYILTCVCGNRNGPYMDIMYCDKQDICSLINKSYYIPIYSEKEALQWKLKYDA